MKRNFLSACALLAISPLVVACGSDSDSSSGGSGKLDLDWSVVDLELLGIDVEEMSEACQAGAYLSVSLLAEKVDVDSLKAAGKRLTKEIGDDITPMVDGIIDSVNDDGAVDWEKLMQLDGPDYEAAGKAFDEWSASADCPSLD